MLFQLQMADQPLPEQPPDEAATGLQAAGLQGGLQGAGLQGAGLQGAGLQGLMPPLVPLGAQHPSKLQALTPALPLTIP